METLGKLDAFFSVVKSLEKQITYLDNNSSKNENIKVKFGPIYNMNIQVEFDFFGNKSKSKLYLETIIQK